MVLEKRWISSDFAGNSGVRTSSECARKRRPRRQNATNTRSGNKYSFSVRPAIVPGLHATRIRRFRSAKRRAKGSTHLDVQQKNGHRAPIYVLQEIRN